MLTFQKNIYWFSFRFFSSYYNFIKVFLFFLPRNSIFDRLQKWDSVILRFLKLNDVPNPKRFIYSSFYFFWEQQLSSKNWWRKKKKNQIKNWLKIVGGIWEKKDFVKEKEVKKRKIGKFEGVDGIKRW